MYFTRRLDRAINLSDIIALRALRVKKNFTIYTCDSQLTALIYLRENWSANLFGENAAFCMRFASRRSLSHRPTRKVNANATVVTILPYRFSIAFMNSLTKNPFIVSERYHMRVLCTAFAHSRASTHSCKLINNTTHTYGRATEMHGRKFYENPIRVTTKTARTVISRVVKYGKREIC